MKRYAYPLLTLCLLYSFVTVIALLNKNLKFEFNDLKLNKVTSKYNEYANPESIISANQLKSLIENEDIKIIAAIEDKPLKDYIPSSQVISIKDVSKTVNGIPNFIADKAIIEKVLSEKGISNEDTIVLYDNNNLNASRLWFILEVYGHDDIKILDGGIKAWINSDYKVVSKIDTVEKTEYYADEIDDEDIADFEEIKESINDEFVIFLDARSVEEYKRGRIPKAINVPWTETINRDRTIKSYDELKTIYVSKGITDDKLIYVYCKYGNRAAYTYFVLTELLGYDDVILYDGSWAEYSVSGLPIEK